MYLTKITDRLQHAWNAFKNSDEGKMVYRDHGPGMSYRPDMMYHRGTSNRSIVSAIYNRIAVDVASVDMFHAKLDQNGRFMEEIDSGLDYCLNTEANLDQASRFFMIDVIESLCEEGDIAVIPVETDINPNFKGSYEILSLRTAKIVEWFPKHIRVEAYNINKGYKEQITIPKSICAILHNPFYTIMNTPNSVLMRLKEKLALLDMTDSSIASGKLDLIIQLPFSLKSEAKQKEAEKRRKQIEFQLSQSKYGVAYTDASEHVTQLNRAVDNTLAVQVETLTQQLYNQLGLTQSILDGTANEQTMLNYYNRTIEPFLATISQEFNRKFLTKTSRKDNQRVIYLNNPFKLVPVSQIAEIADKFTRNAILTSNDIRPLIGYKPAEDPVADELRNKNIAESKDAAAQKNDGIQPNGDTLQEEKK